MRAPRDPNASTKMSINAYPILCSSKDVKVYTIGETLNNEQMTGLMNVGWTVISSWIDNVIPSSSDDTSVYVQGVGFRLARRSERLIVNANIVVNTPLHAIANMDSDEPGSAAKIVPSVTSEYWLLRAASIAGFGTASGGGPGAVPASGCVEFSIVGLDIEVSTLARKGNMPLPHDDIVSIAISNGAWIDDMDADVCYCIYTGGFHTQKTNEDKRPITYIKVTSSTRAVEKAYEILTSLSPDFVNVHNGFGFDLKVMATHCASSSTIGHTFEERKLGNTGNAIYWRIPNGTTFVDSMYDIDKYLRKDWTSMSLASVARVLDLPPKLDVNDMAVEITDEYDVTEMAEYNVRDSDLHAWVIKRMRTCERYFMLAGTSRSTIWDAVAGNTGNMMFCFQQSVALSQGSCLDLSKTLGTDEREFEGGFVLEPKPGCYKGVVVIDGNSLYGSIMSRLGIFIDRCASSSTARGLAHKLGRDVEQELGFVDVGDVVESRDLIMMRSDDAFLCVVKGGPTMLTVIINDLINKRKEAKRLKQEDRSWAYKLLLVSVYGAMGSRHGVLSSKTCAEITTYAARYYLKSMVEAARACGYEVLYGDTDSIFVWVKGTNEISCSTAAMRVRDSINKRLCDTVFADVGADMKGNYSSIVITAKKKYEAVNWDGSLETKGLAMVKKDSLPIVKYCLSVVMSVLNSSHTDETKTAILTTTVGKVMRKLQDGLLPLSSQVTEVKVGGQPHIVYRDANMRERRVLIGIGVKVSDVNKKWVAARIASAMNSVLVPVGMNNVSELLFAYETRRLMANAH